MQSEIADPSQRRNAKNGARSVAGAKDRKGAAARPSGNADELEDDDGIDEIGENDPLGNDGKPIKVSFNGANSASAGEEVQQDGVNVNAALEDAADGSNNQVQAPAKKKKKKKKKKSTASAANNELDED